MEASKHAQAASCARNMTSKVRAPTADDRRALRGGMAGPSAPLPDCGADGAAPLQPEVGGAPQAQPAGAYRRPLGGAAPVGRLGLCGTSAVGGEGSPKLRARWRLVQKGDASSSSSSASSGMPVGDEGSLKVFARCRQAQKGDVPSSAASSAAHQV